MVEFVAANTYELRFRSNIETAEEIAPHVYCAFIRRNVVGEVEIGEITTYPAVIIRARQGVSGKDSEIVTIEMIIGMFDNRQEQQGSRDCLNVIERIKHRLREQSIVRERFPVRSINWQINKRVGGGASGAEDSSYPYFFAEMQIEFELVIIGNQYETTYMSPEVSIGRLNAYDGFPRATPTEDER